MKRLIIELEDDIAKRLEQVAPGRSRRRLELIRNAIRKALWEIEEQATAEAYRLIPDFGEDAYFSPKVWEARAQNRNRRSPKAK